MNKDDLFFSIIIPLFNKENYIERCIKSALAQTFTNFEVIIVDDGSTDSSVELITAYKDDRIRIVQQKNLGPGAARNRGISESYGQWICFLDADDAWLNVHLGELKLAIDYDEQTGIVATRIKECLYNKNITFNDNSNKSGKISYVDYFSAAAKFPGFINSSSVAIKRTVLEEIGGFKHWYTSEDQELWARICLRYQCVTSDKQTAFYFRGTGGIMESPLYHTKGNNHKIKQISDINPTLAILTKELKSIPADTQLHQSIIQYINSRITISVRSQFYRGDIPRAKEFSCLYLTPTQGTDRFWFLTLKFPPIILQQSANSRILLRWIYRHLRSWIDYLFRHKKLPQS